MKTKLSWLKLGTLVTAVAFLGGRSLGQPAQAPPQIDPSSGQPLKVRGSATINPTTGLPGGPGGAGIIDPATGLPVSAGSTNAGTDYATSVSLVDQARELMNGGHYEEALQRYLSFRQQTLESTAAAPLVVALPGWVELGRAYPKAKEALIELRDQDLREFVQGRGQPGLFSELAAIDKALAEEQTTYALFKGIEQADSPLAAQCYFYIEADLVARGEYDTCARYCGNPQFRFDTARRLADMGINSAKQSAERELQIREHLAALRGTNAGAPMIPPSAGASAVMANSATNQFVRSVTQLIEILVGTEQKGEAEKIRDQAMSAMDHERLRSAVADAEARVQAIRASPPAAPKPIAIHSEFAESEDLFTADLVPPSASVEHWSPALDRGVKPDLAAIRNEAKQLADRKQYEEALQRHIWYYNHALEYEPEAARGVRLSFALSDWAALGRKYPKARQAMLELRDRDIHEFANGRGSPELFKDVAAINDQWDYYRTTCRLFHFVMERNAQLAKRCYGLAEGALVKNREYELCAQFVGDGQGQFDTIRANWERLGEWENRMAAMRQESQKRMEQYWAEKGQKMPVLPPMAPPRSADNLMVGKTRQLIEILVGAGHRPEAERIRDQALALLDNDALKSAIPDAERKTGR
jgi:hypothetical protein